MTEKPVKKLKGKKLPSIQEKESFEPLQELSEPSEETQTVESKSKTHKTGGDVDASKHK